MKTGFRGPFPTPEITVALPLFNPPVLGTIFAAQLKQRGRTPKLPGRRKQSIVVGVAKGYGTNLVFQFFEKRRTEGFYER